MKRIIAVLVALVVATCIGMLLSGGLSSSASTPRQPAATSTPPPVVHHPTFIISPDGGSPVVVRPKDGTASSRLGTLASSQYKSAGFWRTRHRTGCVTVDNIDRATGILGAWYYTYTTKERFCWFKHHVEHRWRSWNIDGPSSNMQWLGFIWNRIHYFKKYRWWHSGYIQDRKAQVETFLPIYGQWQVHQPVNYIHTYAHPAASGVSEAVVWMAQSS